MSTYIYCDADQSDDWNNQGTWAFTLTYEGWPLSYQQGPLTRWGTYSGTLTPEAGTTALQAKADVLKWVEERAGVNPAKVLCWSLMENELPRRGPIE